MKTLLIDYNGPIIKADNFFENRSKRVAKIFRIKWDKKFQKEWAKLYIKVSDGTLSLDDYYKVLSKITKKPLKGDENEKFMVNERLADKNTMLHIKALRKKFGKKLKMGVHSNYSTSWVIGFLKKNKIENYFDKIIVSDEIKLRKPDLRAYRLAARMLNSKPNECIYVGDEIEDLEGASAAGMQAVFMRGEDTKYGKFPHIKNLGEIKKFLK